MRVVGLISGTSVDAIDAALVDIEREGDDLLLELRGFVMQPFDPALRERVRGLLPPHQGSTVDVCEVHALLGEAFADAVDAVVAQAGVDLPSVDLVASHGQTVYHQIAPGAVRSTLQLGSAATIAERTGSTTVADFRPRDMAAGGEGAPLVPYLDQLLFTDPNRHRALQNIGGIGNVTYLPAGGAPFAFDTGPGNVLIDEAVRLLTDGHLLFDADGRLAAAGEADAGLVERWLQHPFFALQPPKSTGREAWGPAEARQYVAEAQARGLDAAGTVRTITAFSARSIADAYRRFLGPVDEVFVGGGGARNPVLMELLQAALPDSRVAAVDAIGLDADAKESLAFAVLGYATLHGWPSNVPAATGAAHPAVLGNITPGAQYRRLLALVLASEPEAPRRARLVEPR